MRGAGHVARMEESRDVYNILVGKSEGRDHLDDPGVDGKIILRWIFRNWVVGAMAGSSWFSMGKSGGHF